MNWVSVLYGALKFLGLMERLITEHESRAKAQIIANAAPVNDDEEADYWKPKH